MPRKAASVTHAGTIMTRNGIYVLVGVLLVAVIGLGVYIYQQQQSQPALEIRVDEQGISVEGNG